MTKSTRYMRLTVRVSRHPDHPYGCHEWPAVVMEVAEEWSRINVPGFYGLGPDKVRIQLAS